MVSGQVAGLFRRMNDLLDLRQGPEPTDGRLIEAFVTWQDESAFASLVQRHASMVMNVCRHVLQDAHEAEDAFQAAFLVLARKAASIRQQESVAGWLYCVAYRVANQARAGVLRRRTHERPSADPSCSPRNDHLEAGPMTADATAEVSRRELRALLDAELCHLPEKYRIPLVLCYLEGKTHVQAAAQLSWAAGTLKSRLARGGELLRARLTRRGVALSVAAVATHLAEGSASSAVPARLIQGTIRAAVAYSTAAGTAVVSTKAVALAEGALKTMSLSPLKVLTAVLLMLGLAGAGTGVLLHPSAAAQEAKPAAPEEKRPEPPPAPRVDLHGDTVPPDVLARLGTLQWRHGDNIDRVVFGPEAKTLISTSADGTVRVWDRQTGKELRRFPATSALAISPDGTLLAQMDKEHRIHVLDLATGKELHQYKSPLANVSRPLLFSPDGKLLATADEQRLCIWATDTGKEIAQIKAKPIPEKGRFRRDGFGAFVFSANGKRLAVTLFGVDKNDQPNSTVNLYDAATGKELCSIEANPFGANGLSFTPDGKQLAIGGDDKIHLHDAETGKEVRALPGEGNGTGMILFTPDGKGILTTDTLNGPAYLKDVETGKRLQSFGDLRRLGGGVRFVVFGFAGTGADTAFSPDGKLLARGEKNTIRLWDVATGKELPQVASHRGKVSTVAVTPDGKTALTLGDDHIVRCWDLATSKEISRFPLPDGAICLTFAPNGKTAAIGMDNKTILLFDPATGKELLKVPAYAGGVSVLAFSANGKLLAARGGDPHIRILDAATGKELRRIAVPMDEEPENNGLPILLPLNDPSIGLVFAPDGKTILSQAAKNTLRLWEVDTGLEARQIQLHAGGCNGFAFSPDGRTIAVENPDRTVSLFEVAGGKERARFGEPERKKDTNYGSHFFAKVFYDANSDGPAAALSTVAFSPDGRLLATRGTDCQLHLWDVVSGKQRRALSGHQGDVATLAFAPDGKTLLSGSHDTTALVWDVADRGKAERPAAAELTPAQMESLWKDLGAEDATAAYRSINTLTTAPQATLAFLAKHLSATPAVDAAKIDGLIADLNAEKFAVRQQARAELEKLGDLARPALAKVLEGQPSLEMSQRVESILRAVVGGPPTAEQLRQSRALEVLERIGMPEARKLLESLAGGAAGARQTREARAALERLGK